MRSLFDLESACRHKRGGITDRTSRAADRVKTLLGKLNSIVLSKIRGSKVSKEAESLLHKFMQQVEKILKI